MQRIKPMLRQAMAAPAVEHMLTFLERGQPAAGRHLKVLTYHVIDDPAGFAAQAAHLARHYHVLSMAEALAALEAARQRNRPLSLPPRSLLITFDDAYTNFATEAWPVLRKHGLPVTLFVPTAFPDRPERLFWWERLTHALTYTPRRGTWQTPFGPVTLDSAAERRQALKRLKGYLWTRPPHTVEEWAQRLSAELDAPPPPPSPVLDWAALRRLAAEGVTLAPHTRTHPNMALLSAAEVEEETAGSLADLVAKVGPVLPVFAYPGGYYSQETVAVLQRVGIRLAFTRRRGTNDMQRANWLELRRNNVGAQANRAVLQARLVHATPYLDWLR